ncbi:GntR family transcriptional regulator [Miniphocaeibacter halophilus]|uniref:GntR family transcriptional regulator n=1 Tax=Miniphocaeibacter halophilus TaxID=2931922 RepID=A0AC61MRH0_9FIRM|nr:GntR family transcriptional regulator [Miniphocaeibacter halophilus]QQK07036.1 GntR family transcriptional regulator [Miniphocaeibacter halophilus]
MKFNDFQPIYIQIMDYIKYQIIRGELKIDEKVPSVREIASTLKVNPNTVQRSYSELEREDVIYAKRGLGNFVTSDPDIVNNLKEEKAKEILDNFLNEIRKLGLTKYESIKLIEEGWKDNE